MTASCTCARYVCAIACGALPCVCVCVCVCVRARAHEIRVCHRMRCEGEGDVEASVA